MGTVNLTVTQLRNVLQLPERPFEDVNNYDGTKYYDLTHREPCTILLASGTASATSRLFVLNTDFQITAGCIDWSPAGVKPDLFSAFYVDYTYSRLGGDTASTCVANAKMVVQNDLGSTYPYGSTSVAGISYDTLATYAASLVAAREACLALATTEIDLASKTRRGSVLVDDTKKSEDWEAAADRFQARYKRYLTAARGMIRYFGTSGPTPDRLLFGAVEAEVFDNLFLGSDIGGSPYGAFV